MTRCARLAAAAALAALSAVAIFLAREIPSRHVRGDPGPQAFPIATAAVVLGGALVVLAGELRGPRGGKAGIEPWNDAALVGALMVAYLALMTPLGFVLSTALFLAAVSRYLDRERRFRAAGHLIAGAGVAAALWLAFGRLLGVVLPAGPWGF